MGTVDPWVFVTAAVIVCLVIFALRVSYLNGHSKIEPETVAEEKPTFVMITVFNKDGQVLKSYTAQEDSVEIDGKDQFTDKGDLDFLTQDGKSITLLTGGYFVEIKEI